MEKVEASVIDTKDGKQTWHILITHWSFKLTQADIKNILVWYMEVRDGSLPK